MRPITTLALAGFCVLGVSARQAAEPAGFDRLIRLAQQQQLRNDFAGAARSYQEALKLRPDVAELHANLGLMEYETGNRTDSVEQFRQALEMKPGLFVPNLFLGKEYLRRNDAKAALAFFLRAEKTNSRDLELNLALGRTYMELGSFMQAGTAFQMAISIQASSEEAWYGLGVSYLDRAQAAGSVLAQKFPDSKYFGQLREEYRETKRQLESTDIDEAPGSERMATEAVPALPAKQAAGVAAAYRAGNYQDVAAAGDRLIEDRNYDPALLYWTVKADTRLAVAAFERAGAVNPASPRIHLLLGDLYRRKGNYLEAGKEFQKALAIDPADPAGLLGLATTYYLDAQYELATKIARQVLDKTPGDAEANVLMAQILVEQRSFDDASAFLAVPVNEHTELAGRVHALRGKILAAGGRRAEAIREYELAAEYDNDGSVHYLLGKQYQMTGNNRAAKAAFKRSRELRLKSTPTVSPQEGIELAAQN